MENLLKLMQESLEAKNKMTDMVCENITNESRKGNKKAQAITNYAKEESDLKQIVSKAIH